MYRTALIITALLISSSLSGCQSAPAESDEPPTESTVDDESTATAEEQEVQRESTVEFKPVDYSHLSIDPNSGEFSHDEIMAAIVLDSRVVSIGETHGNTAGPETTSEVARLMLEEYGAVTVGIEWTENDQEHIDTYLDSAGTEEDRKTLTDTQAWTMEWADGRSSEALVDLIEELRSWREDGEDVEVVAFMSAPDEDGVYGDLTPEQIVEFSRQREREDASIIVSAAEADSTRPIVLFTGNLHARLTDYDFGAGPIKPLSAYLKEDLGQITAIELEYDGGSSFILNDMGFNDTNLMSNPRDEQGLLPFDGEEAAFHFIWAVGPAVASPPARSSVMD